MELFQRQYKKHFINIIYTTKWSWDSSILSYLQTFYQQIRETLNQQHFYNASCTKIK